MHACPLAALMQDLKRRLAFLCFRLESLDVDGSLSIMQDLHGIIEAS